MQDQVFYSFDKSRYKKPNEIEKEYKAKAKDFLAGKKLVDLTKAEREKYDGIINGFIRDPRQQTMFYNTKEAAIDAKKRADALDSIVDESEPEILTYLPE